MCECLISGKQVDEFISFGKMPIANGFLDPDEFEKEYFFELKVGFCQTSKMVQLTELVEPQKMFHDNYAFYSSTSRFMERHFAEFADYVTKTYLKDSKSPFVAEVGSNDGIMLKNFAAKGIKHLGIEPSGNVAEVARKKGIHTISEFFNDALADKILKEYGEVDAFLGANVMCHIESIKEVISGVKKLLKPKGVLMFEDPYLGDIIKKTSYDQIYDEHVFYFSVNSISYLVALFDMEVIDVLPQHVHGGSMRYVISHKGVHPVSAAVERQKQQEEAWGLDKLETYHKFKQNVERSRRELMIILNELREKNKTVVGYGATSKSTTVMNYCGITSNHLQYISDTTPIKQGKFTPGTHIPVKPYEVFKEKYPEYALLFAWNHAKEIMEKENEFMKSGGKWIQFVPTVQVL